MIRNVIMALLLVMGLVSTAHANLVASVPAASATNLKNVIEVGRDDLTTNLRSASDTLSVAFCPLPQAAGTDCTRPISYALCTRNDCGLPSGDRLTLILATDDRLLLQAPGGLPGGDYRVKVTLGSLTAEIPKMTVERAPPLLRSVPYVASMLVILLMLWGAYAIVSTVPTEASLGTLSFAGRLLLDRGNMTFSLSKFQFYGWTAVSVAAYVFYATARVLVQGQWDWAASDIGTGLPLVFLTAAGTSVITSGLNSATGGKGGGEFHPSLADLITSGGVVAPERVQFLAWTVIGWLSFLFFTFAVGPDHLSKLPSVPDGFIELMGASSLGYLGGKLARGPGPQVRGGTIEAPTPDNQVAVLTVTGLNLGTAGATYQLAGKGKPAMPLRPDWLKLAKSEVGANKMATRLVFEIPAADYKPADLSSDNTVEFVIVNPNAEKAVWPITLP